jgi:hypothetical protein
VTVTITATPNAAPTVANPIPNQTATAGQSFSYAIPANTFADDAGTAALTYTAAGLPSGLSFSNGTISGTPTTAGVSSVTITATDAGGLSASSIFTLTVNAAPNQAPTTTGIANQTATVNKPFSLNTATSFADPENQALTYSATRLPRGLSIVATTGVISGSPAAVGVTSITVTATDPGGLAVSAPFMLTVTEAVNTAPVASPIANQTATVDVSFSMTVPTFTDAETPNDLTYSVTGLPKGLSFNAKNMTISGTPTTAGVSSVTVTATDPGKLSSSTIFTITVNPAAGNTPPIVVSPVANATISVGQSYSLNVASVFTDNETPNQLTYSVSGLSKGLTFSQKTNTISGSPNAAGVMVITLTATDPGKMSTSTSYTLTVKASAARMAAESVENTLKLEFEVYPNPVVGSSVTVQIRNAAEQTVKLRLIDLRGKVIYEQQIQVLTNQHTERVELGTLPAGLLLLHVSTDSQSQSKTILKQ